MAEIELREVPLFSEMDEQEVAGIREIMEEMKFKPGQVIIRDVKLLDGDHVDEACSTAKKLPHPFDFRDTGSFKGVPQRGSSRDICLPADVCWLRRGLSQHDGIIAVIDTRNFEDGIGPSG